MQAEAGGSSHEVSREFLLNADQDCPLPHLSAKLFSRQAYWSTRRPIFKTNSSDRSTDSVDELQETLSHSFLIHWLHLVTYTTRQNW